MLDLELFTLCRFNIERQNSKSNGRVQYYHLPTSLVLTSKVILKFYEMYLLFFLSIKEQVINLLRPVLTSKVILKFYEMYLLFFLSIKEQVINLLRPVGKCNPSCYLPSIIQITLGSTLWDLDDFGWISGRIALSNRVYLIA